MQICPNCQGENTRKNGKTRTQQQRYRCNDCGRGWSDSLKARGRPPINEVAMTNTERQRRFRLKSS